MKNESVPTSNFEPEDFLAGDFESLSPVEKRKVLELIFNGLPAEEQKKAFLFLADEARRVGYFGGAVKVQDAKEFLKTRLPERFRAAFPDD